MELQFCKRMPCCQVEKKIQNNVIVLTRKEALKNGKSALDMSVDKAEDCSRKDLPEASPRSLVQQDASWLMHSYGTVGLYHVRKLGHAGICICKLSSRIVLQTNRAAYL